MPLTPALCPRDVVEVDDQPRRVPRRGRILADQGHHTRVDHRLPPPLLGVGRVQRQVGGTRAEDGQQRDQQLRRAGQQDRDHPFRAGAVAGQHPGQPRSPRVQLAVAHPDPVADHGGRLRGPTRLVGEEVRDQRGTGRQRSALAQCHHRTVLVGGQDLHRPDRKPGIGHHRPQHPLPPAHQQLDGLRLEQVGGELHHPAETARYPRIVVAFGQGEQQVVPGGSSGRQVRAHVEVRQPETGGGCVLQGEGDLEQRVVRRRPPRVENLHQVLEGHVLVRVGGQRRLPDTVEQHGEGGVAAGVGAQHQRVDEEPDEVVQRLVGASGDTAAQRDVVTGAEPGEQRRQRRLEDHEHRRPGPLGERGQSSVQLGVEDECQVVAPVGGGGRSRTVGGQVQLVGYPSQLGRPVRDLLGEPA